MSSKKRARFQENEEAEAAEVKTVLNRKEAQRKVAESRAEHFARADKPKSSASTTPTGSLRPSSTTSSSSNSVSPDAEPKESWPGPWSTARNILTQREEAKKAREAKQLARENAANCIDMDAPQEADLDIYDQEVLKLKWEPTEKRGLGNYIPKLSSIILAKMAKHAPESLQALQGLSEEFIHELAELLGKDRKLSNEVILSLCIPDSGCLYIPDCSGLDEETLITAIEQVCSMKRSGVAGDEGDEVEVGQGKLKKVSSSKKKLQPAAADPSPPTIITPMTSIIMKNAGRCFSDKIAAIFMHPSLTEKLEGLVLTGLFKLSQVALMKVLEQCARSLVTLDLSCNNFLQGTESFRGTLKKCEGLRSLHLDYVPGLNNNDILTLLLLEEEKRVLPCLEEVSLLGCAEIGDLAFVPLFTAYGKQLTLLHLSGSDLITDISLMALREHSNGGRLVSLKLMSLPRVTTEALLGLFMPYDATSGSSYNSYGGSSYKGSKLGELQVIDLKGTSLAMTDEVLILLAQVYRTSLVSLGLAGCHQLTNRGLAALWLHCGGIGGVAGGAGAGKLGYLDLSFLRSITEPAFGRLLDRCANLMEVKVWGNTQLTGKVIGGHRNPQVKITGQFCSSSKVEGGGF